MKVITFASLKGGAGKSSLAIMTANYLANAGKRVLFIDSDLQNSSTFFYLPEGCHDDKSLANVLDDTGSSLADNTYVANNELLNIVPSSLELINRRDCDVWQLKNKLAEYDNKKCDYVVIDTPPTFDNVVISCLLASDIIITPCVMGGFDLKSAAFYKGLLTEINCIDKWAIVLNKKKKFKTGGSLTATSYKIYADTFGDMMMKSNIPEMSIVKQYFDMGIRITQAKTKLPLLMAMTYFVREITGDKKIFAEEF